MRGELEVPGKLASSRGYRENRIRVEIVTFTLVAVVIRTGVARGPEQQISFRVVSARKPSGDTRMFERPATPGFRAGRAGFWRSPKSPDFFAGGGAESGKKAADALVAARRTGDHQIVNHKRR